MTEQQKTYVVIPAFNEESRIAEVIALLKPEFRNIVVIDDGSTDDTSGAAQVNGAIVLRHHINFGQGAALQTGLEYCSRRDADFVVTFDADGQHSVADALKMLETAQAENYDVVLGSRFKGNTIGMPTTRQLVLKMAVIFTILTTGLKLTDAHNGLRVLGRKALRSVRLKENRMAHASEILEKIAALKLSYIEVPITITYTEYSLGKGQKISNAVNILLDLLVRKFL